MSQNIITRKELELTVAETESLINTLVIKKYAERDEKTLGDVIERIIKIVEEKGNKKYITPKILSDIKVMLREGYFIPGGSVLSGLSNNKTLKSSLSNCYVLKIERDCIECIFKMFGEMAKTYSYRGGCGVDITVLRPNGTPVSNAAKKSTGAVSFMPMISNVTETIGQCLAFDTWILTKTGLKWIQDVQVGDYVWTKIGWVKVLENIKNKKMVNRLSTKNGFEIGSSKDHVYQGISENIIVEKTQEEFNSGDHIVMISGTINTEVPYVNLTHQEWTPQLYPISNQTGICGVGVTNHPHRIKVPKILNEKFGYLLGFSFGNGSVEYNERTYPYSMSLSCGTIRPEIQYQICQYIEEIFNIIPSICKGSGAVNIGNIEFCSFLEENQLLKTKSTQIRIPNKIFKSPVNVQTDFLAGFFDADRYNSGSKKGYVFSTTSKGFAQDIQIILSSLGVYSKIHIEDRTEKGWHDLYLVTVTGTYNQWWFVQLMSSSIKVNENHHISKKDFIKTPYTAKGLAINPNDYSFVPSSGYLSCNTLNKLNLPEIATTMIQDEVFEIKEEQEMITHDLRLESEHLFWANGFYAHNSGRRGAMMITMDIRHPDIMEFIWSKADPERVFYQDHMNKTHIGKKILSVLTPILTGNSNVDPILKKIGDICKEGKIPTVDTANISIKYTNEFMTAVRNDEPWVCIFPDMEADKEKYDLEWDGDYEKWVANGGKLKKHTSYTATITKDNYFRFIDHFLLQNDQEILLTKEYLTSLVSNGNVHVTLKMPTARQIFYDACLAAWLRGDPGALFWDRVNTWTTMTVLHELLKFLSTNPCSEIPSYAGGSCLLGSHVLSRYVKDPWTDHAKWDSGNWNNFSMVATYLMNVFSDINEDIHPLDEQTRLEKFAKRIGIEFTALGDTCAMLGMEYGDNQETLQFIENIMRQKSILEIFTSNQIAKDVGCCPVFNQNENPGVRERFLDTPYVKHLALSSELKENIQEFGLRNVGFNTVGPTGSLSILMDNCSSGIEPIFAFTYTRTTRVGDQQEYKICHTPLARYLLSQDQDTWDLDEVKKKYKIKTAHELGYKDRIAVQSATQLYCDSSISSTLNLPKDCTVDNIMDIYMEAWEAGLKGVTVYRDGSLSGVLNIEPQEEKEVTDLVSVPTREQTRETFSELYSIPEGTTFEVPQLGRGELLDPQRDSTARSHRIAWNGYNMYITITLDAEGQPLELFISNLPREVSVKNEVFDPIDYQEKLSLWMAVTRLVSIGLRGGIPVVQFVKQLNKASFVVNDLMSIVARVLSQYVGDPKIKEQVKNMSITELTETDFTSECPKCGQKTYIYQGGCGQCMNNDCAYTKCN